MQFVNEQEGPSNKEEVNKKTYLMDEDYNYRLCLGKTCQMLFNAIFSPVQNHKLQRAEGHLLQVTFFGSNYDNF